MHKEPRLKEKVQHIEKRIPEGEEKGRMKQGMIFDGWEFPWTNGNTNPQIQEYQQIQNNIKIETIDHWNRIEIPEISPHLQGQLIFDRGANNSRFNNWFGRTV